MKARSSIRVKLTLSFVLIAVITSSLSILLGFKLIFDRVIQEAQLVAAMQRALDSQA